MKKTLKLFKIIVLSVVLIVSSMFIPKTKNKDVVNNVPTISKNNIEEDKNTEIITPITEPEEIINIPVPEKKQIVLSFVGDCTLGTDDNFGYTNTFTHVFDKNDKDYSYFFKGVKEVLENDDLTIANLETTFTNATVKKDKQFNFKGDPSYVNILLEGSVEVVNLANNHTYDYYEKGYNDTVDVLKSANVGFYGNNVFLVEEVQGVKIGFAGFNGFGDIKSTSTQIKTALEYFEENNIDIKIVSFHWGIERENYFNEKQQTLGRFAIDNGANLVIGHHPHVLQGIEEYNGNYIVYSLGNFVFGGNRNPQDKDSMIFQKIFTFEDNQLIDQKVNIIPVSISSQKNINDYQPTLLEDEEKVKVLTRINKYSKNFNYEINE